MKRTIDEILYDIETFSPAEGDWRPLDCLFTELWQYNLPTSVIPVLFRVFERFPDEDGGGVLWSIVHGIESRNDYEDALRQSLSRQQSHMGRIMFDRLMKSR